MERNLSIRQPLHRRFRHVKVLRTEFYVLTIPDARHAYFQRTTLSNPKTAPIEVQR